MSDQALLTAPEQDSAPARLQERTRAFTAFYEQHAYLAYNLALRITCAPGPAGRAAQAGFLRQLEDSPEGLVPATVASALRDADGPAEPEAAGEPQAQALLRAMSTLPPVERAALAMADLAQAGEEELGEALGLPADQAAKLLERARDGLAHATGLSRERADDAASDWMWAAPPDEVWQELYPRFHRAAERQLRARGAAEQTLVLKAEGAHAPAKPTRAAKRRMRRERRRPLRGPAWLRGWRLLLAAGLLVAAAVVASGQVAREGGGAAGDPAGEEAPPATWGTPKSSGASTGDADRPKRHKPLTAALLDKLRLRELRQLRAYAKREADKSLPARERRAASRRVAALERAARARLRAQQRRAAAQREREARELARRRAAPPPPSPPPTRTRDSSPTEQRNRQSQQDSSTGTSPPRNREEAERTCLLDESSGQYICPN